MRALRPSLGLAEAPEPQKRQQSQCRLGQRDGQAEAEDECPEDGAAERDHVNDEP